MTPSRKQDAVLARIAGRVRAQEIQPHADHGFFGPGSVTWRVWGYATSLTVGFQRAVVVEELDPFLLASVQATDKVRTQARIRYDHTIRYFATVAFADARTAVEASAALMRIHARAVGTEPVSGQRYDANDPESQLWILLTGWHSVLYAYETYGPGPLTPAEDRQFWAECAIAAELQTCDPARVPRSRAEIREYFEAVRPRLAATEATQAMMDHLLGARAVFPPLPAAARPGAWLVNRVMRAATLATLPRWQRRLAGLRQPRPVDAAVRPMMRVAFRAADLSARAQLAILSVISPSTVPVVAPALLGLPAHRPETTTPAEAFARYGVPTPAELRAQIAERPASPSIGPHGHEADDVGRRVPLAG